MSLDISRTTKRKNKQKEKVGRFAKKRKNQRKENKDIDTSNVKDTPNQKRKTNKRKKVSAAAF